MTSGIALFAYNTTEINYIKIALIAARYAKRHMPHLSVCVITDAGTWDWFSQGEHSEYVEKYFDDVILTEPDRRVNKRTHYDSPYSNFVSDFKNGNKHKIIEYTPYDKTLLIDIDYIIQNDSLSYLFESDEPVAMFHNAESLIGEPPALPQQHLHSHGIDMIWSTAIYFDKHDEITQTFFETWAHVAKEYQFYEFLYGFPGHMYRTDYCVSIAAHIMNGMGHGKLIGDFPMPMINMSQHDDIVEINAPDEWVYMVNDRKENWKNTVALIKNENVHVMNKRSLDRKFDEIMERLDNE